MQTNSQPYPYTDVLKVVNASDNVTTINYVDATKAVVASIVQTSVIAGKTVTETFDGAGATTLVITRVTT